MTIETFKTQRMSHADLISEYDALEARTGSGEGAALARLHKLEAALRDEMKRQAVQD